MASRHLRTIAHGLILVSAMLGLIAAALWLRTGPLEPQALARLKAISTSQTGVPDSGQQRQAMIEQLEALNNRLGRIENGLRSGAFVVQMIEPKAGAKVPARDETKGAP